LSRYLAIDPSLHGLYIAKCPGGHRQPGCGMFIWGKLHIASGADGGKLDLNTLGPISTNMVGGSWGWPTSNESERARIYQAHKDYDQGTCALVSVGAEELSPSVWCILLLTPSGGSAVLHFAEMETSHHCRVLVLNYPANRMPPNPAHPAPAPPTTPLLL
jgi:hypothetical protein